MPFAGSSRGSPAAPDENPKTVLPREARSSMLNIGSRHAAGLGFSNRGLLPGEAPRLVLETSIHRDSIANANRQEYLRRAGKGRPARNGTASPISMHGRTTQNRKPGTRKGTRTDSGGWKSARPDLDVLPRESPTDGTPRGDGTEGQPGAEFLFHGDAPSGVRASRSCLRGPSAADSRVKIRVREPPAVFGGTPRIRRV